MAKNTLIIILGPTAIGKSSLAIELAQYFSTEILSADSRQVFRELSIGVARPSEAELSRVPHHLIASASIHDPYSAGTFERQALERLQRLFLLHRVVICAGGSGMYIHALLHGLDDLPSDTAVRATLIQLWRESGMEVLHNELKQRDPDYFDEADILNPHRMIRALEVCRISGKPYSLLKKRKKSERSFQAIKIGLTAARSFIYDRIHRRVDDMVKAGLEEEARSLLPYRQLNALQTVGYQEWFDFFDGKISREQAIDQIRKHTRHYAKRQLTWWRRDPEIHWIQTDAALDVRDEALRLLSAADC